MCNDIEKNWSERYNETVNNPPADGTILKTLGGGSAKLAVEIVEGSPPFIYSRIYVPEIIGAELGWYLQSEDQDTYHGWKCILMPRARAELIRKIGLSGNTVMVKSLKIVRKSQSGKSFLCEVEEY